MNSHNKQTVTVPMTEVEPLLNQLRQATGSTETQILQTLGFEGHGYLGKRRLAGNIPLRTKYAMRGLMAELSIKPEVRTINQLTIEELTDILLVCRGALSEERTRILLKKVALLIAKA